MNIITSISPNERQFSTFEVGKICGVFHTTVINWVNKDRLKAHHTPGGHRRIRLSDLLEFMKQFEMPIPEGLENHKKKVLIVEDDPSVQRMLQRTLDRVPGLQVQACSDGLEALIFIGKTVPDLIVLDIRIPHVNGLEVCRVLKANEQTKPVNIIAITGGILTREERESLEKNAACVFHKPLPTTAFRRKALELLELEIYTPALGV